MTDAALYEVRDRVAVITLNRPDRLNAWSPDLHQGYFESLDRAAADPDVRVIVVTGAGRGFCAGADMDVLQGIGNSSEPRGDDPGDGEGPSWNHTHAMTIPKPVIAAVNGACAGLGFVHALACDIRFAAAGAKFTAAFSRRGLIAEHGSSWTLPRLVGQAVALDIMLSGRIFLAEEAKELGIVNQVFAPDALLDETLAYANDLAVNVSPTSMAVMKQQIYTHPSMPIDAALAESNRLMNESLRRTDFKEGVASFVEKRAPDFAPYSG
jgi:enoyl-CoA hydratase/carnithine racemase